MDSGPDSETIQIHLHFLHVQILQAKRFKDIIGIKKWGRLISQTRGSVRKIKITIQG